MGTSTHTSDDLDNDISNNDEMTLSDDNYENNDQTDSSEGDYNSDDEYNSGESSKSDEYSSSSSESYVGSANSDKFHDPSCTYANKIKDENKVSFSSKDDAIDSGYHSCSYCNP
ncbi:hypothetical protein [Methanobrevibacter sp.]|uniref:hypothetical protein n=1 Tax=Methanobrevibacter sp. TaxID=66852 RepID=UPI002E767797|nr:hypothetical protein [Methanobrevibacter sp.]MEE1336471.1 hypothetical protein [Methanobrevibacter sp.]